MSRSAYFAFASVVALIATPVAFAQSYPESRVVTYGELNLNTEAGADTLIRRINNAAEDVCGRHDGRRPARQAISDRNCEYETTEDGVDQVDHPMVQARYYGGGYIEGTTEYYDSRLDPASPNYDATLDPNSPYYIPPK